MRTLQRLTSIHPLFVVGILLATLLASFGLFTSTVGQTINGITMPGNPYFHGTRGYNMGQQSLASQRAAQFGSSVPPNRFGYQATPRKPFSGAQYSHRPVVTSMDFARREILVGDSLRGW